MYSSSTGCNIITCANCWNRTGVAASIVIHLSELLCLMKHSAGNCVDLMFDLLATQQLCVGCVD